MRTDDDPEVVREAEAMLLRVRDEVWLTLQKNGLNYDWLMLSHVTCRTQFSLAKELVT